MERYKLGDIDNERFYMIPKGIFTNPAYEGIGIIAAVVYSLLKDRMTLSRKNGWADKNGDIYLLFKQADIEDTLHISHPTCVKAMKQLEKYDLIDVIRQGVQKPNKVYIKKLKNLTSRGKKNLHQEVKKINTNDTEYSETEKNDTENVEMAGKPARARKTFQAPTLDEVQAYCQERGNSIDPERFIDFYASKGWMIGKNKMKDWKAAVRNWERRDRERPPQTQRISRAERQRLEDEELERMCREYDSGNSQANIDDFPRKLPV